MPGFLLKQSGSIYGSGTPGVAGDSQYYQQLLETFGSSLIQLLPGDDTVASVARDVGKYNLPGSYSGSPVVGATGALPGNSAINFNDAGSINAFSAGKAAVWNGTAGFLGCFARFNSAATWTDGVQQTLALMGRASAPVQFYVLRKNADNIFYFTSSISGTAKNANYPPIVLSDRYFHLAGTWGGENVKLYVNGVFIDDDPGTGTWTHPLLVSTWSSATSAWPGCAQWMATGSATPTDSQMHLFANSPGRFIFEGDSRSINSTRWAANAVDLAFPDGVRAMGGYGVKSLAVALSTVAIVEARRAVAKTYQCSGKNVLVLWIGVNNWANTAQEIYNAIIALVAAYTADGWRVVLCTEIDSDQVGWSATYLTLNNLIRANYAPAVALIDLGAQAPLQDHTNPAIFSDGTHLTTTGNDIVRDTAYPVLAVV